MSIPSRTAWRYVVTSATAAALAAGSVAAADAFHVTFGTTGDPEYRNADSAAFIAETDSGDIVVAGEGASRWSDDGIGNLTLPLIARFEPNSKLKWQRVYGGLANHRIIALVSRGEEQFVVLVQTGRDHTSVDRLSLRRIDRGGIASAEIGALEGHSVWKTIPVVDGGAAYFLIAAKKGSTSREAYAADVQLLRLDLDGRISALSFPSGILSVDHMLHLGRQEFLSVPRRKGSEAYGSEFIRIDRTGRVDRLFALAGKQCPHVAVSGDRIYCEQYDRTLDAHAIVAYSFAGTELWRHLLEFAPGQQVLAVSSGRLVYSYWSQKEMFVVGLGIDGSEAWSQPLRSTGEYTSVSAIEPLKDGRIALLGSTGPWNGFSSTDTDAMLLVTDVSKGGLSFPQIASTVVRLR